MVSLRVFPSGLLCVCFLWFAIGFALYLLFECLSVFPIAVLFVLLRIVHYCLLYMCLVLAIWFDLDFLCYLTLLCLSVVLLGVP